MKGFTISDDETYDRIFKTHVRTQKTYDCGFQS